MLNVINHKFNKILLNFVCDSEICNWKQSYYTSNTAQKMKFSFKDFFSKCDQIHNHFIIAMREIGRGHTALKTFCGVMNMPPPMQIISFNEMQQNIASV